MIALTCHSVLRWEKDFIFRHYNSAGSVERASICNVNIHTREYDVRGLPSSITRPFLKHTCPILSQASCGAQLGLETGVVKPGILNNLFHRELAGP